MKVIFVGLHNKPGKMPLCSSTKSGKLIDRIIKQAALTNWQKTNLFNVDYWPKTALEVVSLALDWYDRIKPTKNDLIILLGQAAIDCLPRISGPKFIGIAHPASKRSHIEMDSYVAETAAKITSAIEKIKEPF